MEISKKWFNLVNKFNYYPMATKTRNIAFYSIKEWYTEPKGKVYPSNLATIIEFIKKHTKVNRKFNLNVDKFCLIESASHHADGDYYEIVVKSAKHSYRPPLINRKTT